MVSHAGVAGCLLCAVWCVPAVLPGWKGCGAGPALALGGGAGNRQLLLPLLQVRAMLDTIGGRDIKVRRGTNGCQARRAGRQAPASTPAGSACPPPSPQQRVPGRRPAPAPGSAPPTLAAAVWHAAPGCLAAVAGAICPRRSAAPRRAPQQRRPRPAAGAARHPGDAARPGGAGAAGAGDRLVAAAARGLDQGRRLGQRAHHRLLRPQVRACACACTCACVCVCVAGAGGWGLGAGGGRRRWSSVVCGAGRPGQGAAPGAGRWRQPLPVSRCRCGRRAAAGVAWAVGGLWPWADLRLVAYHLEPRSGAPRRRLVQPAGAALVECWGSAALPAPWW
jgi:hypothetical protein